LDKSTPADLDSSFAEIEKMLMFQSLGPKLKKVRGRASREKQIAMMPEDISVLRGEQSLYRTGEEPEQCYADSGQMEKNLYADTTCGANKSSQT